MKELIDKAAVVAEIERRVNDYPCDNSEQDIGYHCALYEMQDFLNTLEVKEVDLDKEIDIYSNALPCRRDDIEIIAKHFFELGLEAQKEE